MIFPAIIFRRNVVGKKIAARLEQALMRGVGLKAVAQTTSAKTVYVAFPRDGGAARKNLRLMLSARWKDVWLFLPSITVPCAYSHSTAVFREKSERI